MRGMRKIAAILVADVVGYSRLAGADEDRTLSRLRGLRSDLIDPAIDAHHGRIVKRTGDGSLIEFRSVVDAVRCAIEVQNGMVERNAGVAKDREIEFRVGIHLGDVVEEADGDLMGDGVNIATRLEGIAKPNAICLSEQAYWQVKGRLDLAVRDLAAEGIANCEHALGLDRNLATAHSAIGLGKIFLGRAEKTEAHVGEAARLSPRDTSAHAWKTFVGVAKLTLGSYEQAAAWFRRAIETNRNYPIPYFLSAAGLAQLGRLDDAHSAVKTGLALNPTFAISRARAAWTAMIRQPDVPGPA